MNDIQHHISLKKLNTFGLDVSADYFCEVRDVATLKNILLDKKWQATEKLILGGGSNILLTRNFPGLVLKIGLSGINVIKENSQNVWLQIGAGENWHQFVLYCLQNNYCGVENLSLIPGTVGAAPIQNIGAYGVELKEIFESLQALQVNNASLHTFNNADCRFGYRDSIFKNELKGQMIICSVTLRLSKQPHFNISYGAVQETLHQMGVTELSIKAVSDAVCEIRRSKLPDPAQIGNAGSFFKNPIISMAHFQKLKAQYPQMPNYLERDIAMKIPAAWLIEQCGYKGKRYGDIGVHQQQALVLVNYGAGEGAALKKLAEEIRDCVKQKFQIELTTEVNIV